MLSAAFRKNIQSMLSAAFGKNTNIANAAIAYRTEASNKKLRTKRVHALVKSLLGRNPIYGPKEFMSRQQSDKTTSWYVTQPTQIRLIQDLVHKIGLTLTGTISDPCCGPDDRAAYFLCKLFPSISRIVLNDLHSEINAETRLNPKVDLLNSNTTYELLKTVDWAVTSPPYVKGIGLSKIIKNIVTSVRKGAILKLPQSAEAPQITKSEWWADYIPNYTLICNAVQYPGFNSKQINNEIWMIWIHDVKVTNTCHFDEISLYL